MGDEAARLRLTEVTLRGFKAAFAPPPIPLQPFNLLIGRNGSGKSTLIEALQWIDTATRKDVYAACDPYNGLRELIHKRAVEKSIRIELKFSAGQDLWVAEQEVIAKVDGGRPEIDTEVVDLGEVQIRGTRNGERLGQLDDRALRSPDEVDTYDDLMNYWRNAVFLRLLPSQLSQPAPLFRKSFDPILDESGRLLPLLLSEVLADTDRRDELLAKLTDLLPWARDIELTRPAQPELPAYYALHEHIPGPGHDTFPIPSWMLSEGTRRVTAILALLVRDPAPSLIAIEELENGLDPWTVRGLLRELQSAADRGIQIIATTHSPWVLDDAPPESILQVRRVNGDIRYERFMDRPEVQKYHPSVPMGTRYVNEAE